VPTIIIVTILAALLSYALRPRPPTPQPVTLNNVGVPTIAQGTPVPVIFGDCWVSQWAVLWYGDLSTTPIKASGGKK